jgi:hypothetical protein
MVELGQSVCGAGAVSTLPPRDPWETWVKEAMSR